MRPIQFHFSPTFFSDSYHNLIYEAILLATTRTLVTLAESSGCEGEAIRAASALSEAPSSHKSGADGGASGAMATSTSSSRVQSAANSDRSRPMSILSMLSSMTWTSEKTADITYLQYVIKTTKLHISQQNYIFLSKITYFSAKLKLNH